MERMNFQKKLTILIGIILVHIVPWGYVIKLHMGIPKQTKLSTIFMVKAGSIFMIITHFYNQNSHFYCQKIFFDVEILQIFSWWKKFLVSPILSWGQDFYFSLIPKFMIIPRSIPKAKFMVNPRSIP